MPNVIITPAFAHIRAQAEADKYNAIASGIQNTTNIVAQTLLTYSQMQKQEDTERLALLDHMVGSYGDQVGQPALEEMDKILKRKGVGGLPKDPNTGQFMTPPQSLDQMMSNEVRNNPELLAGAIQKKVMGVSPIEAHFKQAEIDRKTAHDKMMEDIGAMNAQSSRITAMAAQAKAAAAGEFSGLIQMPDGQIKSAAEAADPESGQMPAGAQALMGRQADRALRLLATNNKRALKAKEVEAKDARLVLDQTKAANYFSYRAGSQLWNMAKAWGAKGTTDPQREVMRPLLEKGLRDADVSEENIKKFFEKEPGPLGELYGWFADFFNPKEHGPVLQQIEQDQAAKGVNAPKIPEHRKLKSGKVLMEEVVPD